MPTYKRHTRASTRVVTDFEAKLHDRLPQPVRIFILFLRAWSCDAYRYSYRTATRKLSKGPHQQNTDKVSFISGKDAAWSLGRSYIRPTRTWSPR